MRNADNQKARILIVDDDASIRNLLCEILGESYACSTAESAEESLLLLEKEKFNLVISDINMRGMSGIELIPNVFIFAPDTVVMMLGGDRTIERVIEAMRVGAFDYLKKPFDFGRVEVAVRRAFDHHRLLLEKRQYEHQL